MSYIERIATDDATFWLPAAPSAAAAEEIKTQVQEIVDRARRDAGDGDKLAHILAYLRMHGYLAVYDSVTSEVFPAPPDSLAFSLLAREDTPAGKLVRDLRDTIPADVLKARAGGASPLRAWRDHLGMSLRELAQKTGVHHATLAQHERSAHPKRETLDLWALGLEVDRTLLERMYRET